MLRQGSEEKTRLPITIGVQRGHRVLKYPDFPVGPNEPLRLAAASRFMEPRERYPAGLFDRVAEVARQHFRVPMATVSLVGATEQRFIGMCGLHVRGTPREQALCNYPVLQDEVFVVPDATKDSRFEQNPLVTGSPFIRFYAAAPLALADGIRIGAVCILDTAPRPELNTAQKIVLRNIAQIAMSELQRHAGPADAAQRRHDQLPAAAAPA